MREKGKGEMMKKKEKQKSGKKKTVGNSIKRQLGYYALFTVPALFIFVFSYVPMAGIYLAFIDYKPAKGFFGSEFVGLKFFKNLLNSFDLKRVMRNTLFYNIAGTVVVGLLGSILFALLLYEIRSKIANKIFQTTALLPNFMSWTVMSAMVLIVLHPDKGIINTIRMSMGLETISFYREAARWPGIIILCRFLVGIGMGSIYYYSALLGIDPELFEVAKLDGANRVQQIWHISMPAIKVVVSITLINSMQNIVNPILSPMYELTFNEGILYETTLTLGIYLLNGIGSGNYSFNTAVGLCVSAVGLLLGFGSNAIIKRIDDDCAMF